MNQRTTVSPAVEADAARLATEATPACIEFLRDLVALPSPPRGERLACERVKREMESLGFDEVQLDPMGNVLGRLGNGPRTIAFDAHIDTVGISRPALWKFDPFKGHTLGGTLFGRGASDQKGGLATLVHGVAQVARLGIPDDLTLWVTATVNGEDCVGLAWQYLIREFGLDPETVVIAMPSHLGICRGQRGRLEIEISTEGVSTHGSQPDRGANAVVAMAPIIQAITRMHRELRQEHEMLGCGSAAVTGISADSPSFTAIPDGCTIRVDRRLTIGETAEAALEEVKALPEVQSAGAEVRFLEYAEPSWRGLQYKTDKIFPAWVTPENSAAFRTAQITARGVLGREPRLHLSAFSSHGCATAGLFDIPTIGFGPANETDSHSINDQISLAQLQPAMAFYSLFPHFFVGQ